MVEAPQRHVFEIYFVVLILARFNSSSGNKLNAKLQTSMELIFSPSESCQPTQVAAKGAYLAAQRSVRLSPQPGLRSEVPGGPRVQDHCVVCKNVEEDGRSYELHCMFANADCDLTSVDSAFFLAMNRVRRTFSVLCPTTSPAQRSA